MVGVTVDDRAATLEHAGSSAAEVQAMRDKAHADAQAKGAPC
jgi:hypothetical protein